MVANFTSWLEKLFEDYPMPDEMQSILFETHVGAYNYVELKAYEREPNINAICYYPIEAQFYHDNSLAKMNEKQFINRLYYLIEECFSNEFLNWHLKNKKIYLKYKNNIKYLFNVWFFLI